MDDVWAREMIFQFPLVPNIMQMQEWQNLQGFHMFMPPGTYKNSSTTYSWTIIGPVIGQLWITPELREVYCIYCCALNMNRPLHPLLSGILYSRIKWTSYKQLI